MKNKKKYDVDISPEFSGFYIWNKPTFYVKPDDNRYLKYLSFKKEHGFSPDESWDLRTNIALFILPRLKYFKKTHAGYPGCLNSNKEWNRILGKMIFAFDAALKDDFYIPNNYLKRYAEDDPDREKKASIDYSNDVDEGLMLFSKYFFALWS